MSGLSTEQLCLLNNVMYSDTFVKRARQSEGGTLGEALRKYTPYGNDVGGVRISPEAWEAVKEKVLGDSALRSLTIADVDSYRDYGSSAMCYRTPDGENVIVYHGTAGVDAAPADQREKDATEWREDVDAAKGRIESIGFGL